ncbi:MAG: hypothetical protein ACYTFY_14035, partial [Planctomycetota bacterium]
MKKISQTGKFTILLLFYIILSLRLLNITEKYRPEPKDSISVDKIQYAKTIPEPSEIKDNKKFTFNINFSRSGMDLIDYLAVRVNAERPLAECTIEAIVECDHHLSYSHTWKMEKFPAAGFSVKLPFRSRQSFWKPVEHNGQWTGWNAWGMRRIQIKIFTVKPYTGKLSLDGKPFMLPVKNDPCKLLWLRELKNPLKRGERFELAFDLANVTGNPYDCRGLGLNLEITPPAGKKINIYPFLYQNFSERISRGSEIITPKGPKHFRVRFRPRNKGTHKYQLKIKNDKSSITLAEGSFEVLKGKAPDFLRVSRKSPRWFEHANGKFFYPVGWNLPYPVDNPYGVNYVPYLPQEKSLSITRKMIDDIADSNGNFIRFWMSDWWNGIEWERKVDNYLGMGRYNLKNAWLIDKVLEHCETRNIHMIFTTMNHVRLTENYSWKEHPYAKKNGGFLNRPQEFWTNKKTRKFSQRRLAYIVSRFADSPAIQSWNLKSEVDLVSRGVWTEAKSFIRSQLRFMKSIDPYRRMTGNHICRHNHDFSFYSSRELDFIHTNAYPANSGLPEDQIYAVRTFSERFNKYRKPVIISEYAGHWAGDPAF